MAFMPLWRKCRNRLAWVREFPDSRFIETPDFFCRESLYSWSVKVPSWRSLRHPPELALIVLRRLDFGTHALALR